MLHLRAVLVSVVTVAALLVLAPGSASAWSGGILRANFPMGSTTGCASTGCHAANTPQAGASLTFLDTPVRGQAGDVRVNVSGNGSHAGFNLMMGNGSMTAPGTVPDAEVIGNEAIHTTPVDDGGGNATWIVSWTPSASGTVSYSIWANSVNNTGGTTGDFPRSSEATGNVFVFEPQGGSCSVNGDCENNRCRDNRCCNTTCTGTCDACSTARGAATNGVCGPIVAEDCSGVASCFEIGASPWFDCSCPSPQYMGDGHTGGSGCTNVNECSGTPCNDNGDHDDNGGQDGQGCTEISLGSWVSPGYTCSCEPGWSQGGTPRGCVVGNECTSGANDCDASPVAVCNDPNPAPTSLDDFTCACPGPGWANHPTNDGHGTNGCVDVDECALGSDTCDGNATCTNTPLGSYTCTCNGPEWEDMGGTAGRVCIDVNECMRDIDNCDPNAMCTNLVPSFSCACNAGYEDAPGTSGGVNCVNIDECARGTDTCDVNATCTDSVGSYDCACNAPAWEDQGGTNGRVCIDVDECTLPEFYSLCSSVATCENSIGAWDCVCNAGFRGDGFDCENIDECAEDSDTCDANGTCADTIGSYTCTCAPGYMGSGFACVDVNECADGTHGCVVNEVCVNNIGAPNDCVCEAGYTLDPVSGVCVVVCGDGLVGAGEECDDANTAVMDGCSDRCTIEPGWACVEPTGGASVCTETCGDGLVDATEECDDGTAVNSDTTMDACRETCVLPSCGDGVVDTGEECDDRTNSDTAVDACRTTCNLPYCGDGIVDTGEICDMGGGLPGTAVVGQCTTLCVPDAGIDPDDLPVLTGGACSCRTAPVGRPLPLGLLLLGLVGAVFFRSRSRR